MRYALVFSIFVLIVSCGSRSEEVPFQIPDDSTAGELINHGKSIDERSGSHIEHKMMLVRENRMNPTSRLIALPVKIYRSSARQPLAPLFFLNGGPGASNMDYRPTIEELALHDVVMVGYRGVDGTARLDCPGVFASSEGNLFSPESNAITKTKMQACVDNLRNQGYDLEGYTMIEVIDDMEDARRLLGYHRVNLLSESYGTRLAQIFAQRYPESIYRSVMVSVNPPGHFVWEPETLDQQIAYYAGLCKQDPYCDGKTDDLLLTVRNVMHDMPEHWLFFPIDPDKVRMAAFMGLYHKGSAASVFDCFIAAENGDASGLAMISMAFDFQIKSIDMAWGDSFAKAFPDFDPDRDYLSAMSTRNSVMGSPGSQTFASMSVWPGVQIPEEYRTVQPTDVQTLLVSGNIDFSTPVEFARDELLPYLSNGEHVILSEMGHVYDIAYHNRPAFTRLLTTFLVSGGVDTSGFTHEPMTFEPDQSFPAMAKIGFAIGVGAILMLFGICLFIVRVVRKRKKRRREKHQALAFD